MSTIFRDFILDIQSTEPQKIVRDGFSHWINPKLSPVLTRDIEESKKLFIGLQTCDDVANILEVPIGQLLHILYSKKPRYNSFVVLKKSGKNRVIDSPINSIKILQNKIKPLIEAHYRVKKPVHGFVGGGKSIVTNAEQHKKKNYVLNIDIQDFFHSVNFGRVQGIFRNTPFNMGVQAATILAQLCTYNGRLPQGASTSPVLSNLAAATLDKKLVQIAKKFHLNYSRYADDITFSSNKPFPSVLVELKTNALGEDKHRAGALLEQVVKDAGFEISHEKTRLQFKSQRQEVTGLVVNDGVNVNRKIIRNTRAMINEWSKDLRAAEVRFIKKRYNIPEANIDFSKLDGSIYKRAVYGNLSFIKMVKGEEHSPYLNLCRKVLELEGKHPKFLEKLKGIFEMYDVFICHASEDKDSVALPLYASLQSKGVKAFIDCFEIKWGDSLVSKINTALQKSRYVIAIISNDSLNKSWPMKELNAVLSSEISSGHKKLLPLIVGDSEKLLESIPLIKDKLFVQFDDNIEDIAQKVSGLLS